MNSEQRMGRINDLMERIDLYKVEPSRASQRVKQAWELLHNFISDKAQFLQENDITPVIYGSVTSDDPKYLDFDICLLTVNDDEAIEKIVEESWVKELSKSWRKIRPGGHVEIGRDGHIEYISFEKLEAYAKALKENRVESVDEEALDIFVYFLEASSILAGDYPYSEPEKENNSKVKFLEIVQQSPLLSAYTIWNLEQTLIQRETRRAGVADHQTGADVYKNRKLGF
jgi:hypothetical protein